MTGLTNFNAAVGVLGPAPPTPPPRTSEPRQIESTGRSSLDTRGDALAYDSSRAVLALVEKSAEQFASLVKVGVDPPASSAMTGSPLPGSTLDVYA